MNPEPLVVVVDDDERICRAVERVLGASGYRVRTFTSALAFLAEQEALEPACLLLDIKIPDLDGLGLMRETRALGAEFPVVFITGSGDVEAAASAMKLGACDILAKPFDEDALVAAVAGACRRGDTQRNSRVRLAETWRALERLTPREAQVGALVTSGRLNKQIAAIIGTTEKTVKVHRARAMAKLGVHSVAELVRTVDGLLAADAPASIVSGEHRVLQRPRALELMQAALSTIDPAASRETEVEQEA